MLRSCLTTESARNLKSLLAVTTCVLSVSTAYAQNSQPNQPVKATPAKNAGSTVAPETLLDPLSQSLIARSKEESQTAESSAITNFQRGVACEKMNQKQAALQFFDKAVLLIRNNPSNYDPKFIKQAYETYAAALKKAGNNQLASVIMQAYSKSQSNQTSAATNPNSAE